MFYREQKRGHTRPMCGDYEKSFSSSWWTMNTLCTWKIKMTVRLFLQLMQKKNGGGCGGGGRRWFREGWNVLFKIKKIKKLQKPILYPLPSSKRLQRVCMCFGRAVIIAKSPNVVVFLLSRQQSQNASVWKGWSSISRSEPRIQGGLKKKKKEHIDLLDSFLMVNKFGTATWHWNSAGCVVRHK